MRISQGSFKTARNGAYIHRLEGDRWPTNLVGVSALPLPRIASADLLHSVYTRFLQALGLSNDHLSSLLGRGFDIKTIQENQYASAPTEERGNGIAVDLEPLGLDDVPGFYKVGNRWRLVKLATGILVPVRNERGQIVGIQIRHDDYGPARAKYVWLSSARRDMGTSSGAPLHFAKCEAPAGVDELLLTEGPMKGDAIAQLLRAPVIAAAGVRLFPHSIGNKINEVFPNLTSVIAFDSDWREKPTVKAALIALQRQLTAAGVPWKVRCWTSGYKGYDDYLLALRRQEAAALANVSTWMNESFDAMTGQRNRAS